jgi:hypothetical protein
VKEYVTYIFEKNKKLTFKRYLIVAVIIATIIAMVILFISGLPGIGLITIISVSIALIKMKNYDDKFMGITGYGARGAKFIIAESHFKLGDSILPFSELTDLTIYVDEYAGMPRELIGYHHGGNNEITFNHNGLNYSVNYIIKNQSDFKKVEKLVNRIENQ